jgi:hypothetical protein
VEHVFLSLNRVPWFQFVLRVHLTFENKPDAIRIDRFESSEPAFWPGMGRGFKVVVWSVAPFWVSLGDDEGDAVAKLLFVVWFGFEPHLFCKEAEGFGGCLGIMLESGRDASDHPNSKPHSLQPTLAAFLTSSTMVLLSPMGFNMPSGVQRLHIASCSSKTSEKIC